MNTVPPPSLPLSGVLLALGLGLSGCGEKKPPPADPSPEIQALHEQRIETFREMVTLEEAYYEDGRGHPGNLIESRRKLLTAQLEAATDPAERLRLLEEILENLKKFEKQVRLQSENGEASPSNLLEVRAARIQAEIDLAEENG